MPYANNQGVRIYYEVEGNGPPLVLAYGLTRCIDDWRRLGYVDALRNDFQLILFDARGHGRSDKPHESSAYGLKMASDGVAVMDSIGIDKAHYFGYSLGARMGFRVATRHADRFHSFILGGASPNFSETGSKVDEQRVTELIKMLLNDPEAALLRREQATGRPLTSAEREAFLANDAQALAALAKSTPDVPPLTDHDLSLISVPCLIFCGDLDLYHAGAKEAAKHMPKARFVALRGLDHTPAFMRSDLVLPHVKEFLVGVSKNQPPEG